MKFPPATVQQAWLTNSSRFTAQLWSALFQDLQLWWALTPRLDLPEDGRCCHWHFWFSWHWMWCRCLAKALGLKPGWWVFWRTMKVNPMPSISMCSTMASKCSLCWMSTQVCYWRRHSLSSLNLNINCSSCTSPTSLILRDAVFISWFFHTVGKFDILLFRWRLFDCFKMNDTTADRHSLFVELNAWGNFFGLSLLICGQYR